MGERMGTPFPRFGRCLSLGKKAQNYLPGLLSGDKVWVRDGRTALWVAFRAAGVGRGNAVLVPSFHCPTMIAPVVWAGAEPVFYDLKEGDSLEPDLDHMLSAARGAKVSVAAVVVAHYFGKPQPRAVLEEIRRLFPGAALVEDCAHLAYVDDTGRHVGRSADFVCFSIRKFFPLPDGGLAVGAGLRRRALGVRTSVRGELRPVVRLLEAIAARGGGEGEREAPPRTPSPGGDANDKKERVAPRFPEAMSSVARACLCLMSEGAEARRRNWDVYDRVFGAASARLPCRPVFHSRPAAPYVYPVRVLREPDRVYRQLRDAGIPVLRWDATWSGMPKPRGSLRQRLAHEILQLPCHQGVDRASAEFVASAVVREIGRAA